MSSNSSPSNSEEAPGEENPNEENRSEENRSEEDSESGAAEEERSFLLDGLNWGADPFAGEAGELLEDLYRFLTRPSNPGPRRRKPLRALQFQVPISLHRRFKRVLIMQGISQTGMLVRYTLVHCYLTLTANAAYRALQKERGELMPSLELPSFGGENRPLRSSKGRRLWEIFTYVTAPPLPSERANMDCDTLLFEMPESLHASLKDAAHVQGLPMTEIMVRYIVVHNRLSEVKGLT